MDWPRQPKSSYLWDQVPASTMLPLRSYLASVTLFLSLPLCLTVSIFLSLSAPRSITVPCSLFFSFLFVLPLCPFLSSSCYTSGYLSPPNVSMLLFLPLDTRSLFRISSSISLSAPSYLAPSRFVSLFQRRSRGRTLASLHHEAYLLPNARTRSAYVYIRQLRHGSVVARQFRSGYRRCNRVAPNGPARRDLLHRYSIMVCGALLRSFWLIFGRAESNEEWGRTIVARLFSTMAH